MPIHWYTPRPIKSNQVNVADIKTIIELREDIRNDSVTSGMLMPCTKAEIFLDLDGDGKADFAFIDSGGTGKSDTYAVDMNGNGDFNIFIKDTDYNGIPDDIRYYPDGSDLPAFVNAGKHLEADFQNLASELAGVLSGEFNGAAFVHVLRDLKAALVSSAQQIADEGKMQSCLMMSEIRRKIRADAITRKMVMPSAKNEVFLDLDGDGKADFALIAGIGGNLDTFAVDMTGNGEFNLYYKDTDFNGIGDDVRYYPDGSDVPSFTAQGKKVEADITDHALKLVNALSGEFDGVSFVQILKELKKELVADSKMIAVQERVKS